MTVEAPWVGSAVPDGTMTVLLSGTGRTPVGSLEGIEVWIVKPSSMVPEPRYVAVVDSPLTTVAVMAVVTVTVVHVVEVDSLEGPSATVVVDSTTEVTIGAGGSTRLELGAGTTSEEKVVLVTATLAKLNAKSASIEVENLAIVVDRLLRCFRLS